MPGRSTGKQARPQTKGRTKPCVSPYPAVQKLFEETQTFSIHALGKRAGVDPKTIYRWFFSRTAPMLDQFTWVCEAAGCKVKIERNCLIRVVKQKLRKTTKTTSPTITVSAPTPRTAAQKAVDAYVQAGVAELARTGARRE